MAVFLFASPLRVKRRCCCRMVLSSVALAAVEPALCGSRRNGDRFWRLCRAPLADIPPGDFWQPVFPSQRGRPGRVVILLGLSRELPCRGGPSRFSEDLRAIAGLFSETDQAKIGPTVPGKAGNYFGGRPEGLVSRTGDAWTARSLGHGSYAVDYKYYELLQEYRYRFGYAEGDDAEDIEDPGIPTHSHLTMAWVEGGVLASLFWFYMLMLIVRCIVRLTETPHPLGPFYSVTSLISLTWDILFSPFGLTRRMWEAFLLLIMINLLRSKPAQCGRTDMRVEQKRLGFRPASMWRPARSFGQTLRS